MFPGSNNNTLIHTEHTLRIRKRVLVMNNQVPPEEVDVEEELVRCLMVLLNKDTGLSALEGSANLWPVLVVSVNFRDSWVECGDLPPG